MCPPISFADKVVIGLPPVNVQVKVNQTAFLRCQASYNSLQDVIYTWLFNDEIIDINKNVYYKQVRNWCNSRNSSFFVLSIFSSQTSLYYVVFDRVYRST